ncbi:HAD family hydrolase [Streptomyces sp. NPDC013157]|uniref:HAD family hydrolase n=1 Tax=Streptomyces sp. NPDC013157 TaxID=3364861 RepID=UPI0036815E42
MDRAAVFDVDGTLVDTNHLHVTTWWEAFRQAGHRVTMNAVHHSVGLGSGDLIAHLLGEDRDRSQDDELNATHTALYGQFFDRLAPLPGAGELLRRLHRDGWRVVLATSASGPELAALRRAIDADDVIAGTASADDVARGKPAPEPVEHALELAGVPADRAVFVGDTVWDMRAGTKAGVRCVGVLCGGIPRSDLVAAGAEEIYADPADLLGSLAESPFSAG